MQENKRVGDFQVAAKDGVRWVEKYNAEGKRVARKKVRVTVRRREKKKERKKEEEEEEAEERRRNDEKEKNVALRGILTTRPF